MKLTIPDGYKPMLDPVQTERAIKMVKDFFQANLSAEMRLRRVTAPLFVLRDTGINDDLNGTERAVNFPIKDMDDNVAEVVHSLAKWKRITLGKLDIPLGYGLYTDMNAIRADEELTNIHSLYVDQWDWEIVMSNEQRKLDFLKLTVNRLYDVLKRTEYQIFEEYRELEPQLPKNITFLHTEELLEMYPDKTPFEREMAAAEKYGAIFIIGIGSVMLNGEKHDGRAPDYDDWSTETVNGFKGLNGDIVIWNPILKRAFEISSMGIRVDKTALLKQLDIEKMEDRKELLFHKMLLNDKLPLTCGGGIGQSRLCMYFLRKAHIGEVQASLWPDEMVEECEKNKIFLM
ncbi:MAG: aspartate--ammonia ligase [Prolixibacteraceae bacterium]|jgi:aspartate--ammonia ligase|nr:aspartate--ammonia ligase [Prolixibacteraceae bacterium]